MKKSNQKILLVCSPYYEDVTKNLIKGASDVLNSKLIEFDILYVPGALEIPSAIKFNANKSSYGYDYIGFVALGCVIRGETYHFEVVSNESARALLDLSIQFSIPIGNGILTVENKEQALIRSDPLKLNKGAGAALACLSLVDIKQSYKHE